MFLKSLRIKNFRSIGDIEIDLSSSEREEGENRKWTILLGQNGTGKSSVLRAIGLILAGSDSLPFLLGEPDKWIRNGEKLASINATIQNKEHEDRHIELNLERGMGRASAIEMNKAGLSELDAALSHTQRSYFTVGYGALRRLAMSESNIPRRGDDPVRSQSLATLFDLDATLNPLQSWAMGLEYREGDFGTRIVEQAMSGLMPEVEFSHIDRKYGDLIFSTIDGDVPLDQLSDGYQNVAAWIGDLLFRVTDSFEDYDNPLETRGVLLIDEIDAHLHPVWQRRLRKYIDKKLPGFQLIGTTHSILTAQQLEEGECIILRREDESKTVGAMEFPGVPADLRAHELLEIGFNVETLDSVRLSEDKDKYRDLYRKEDKTDEDQVELKRLTEQLGDISDRDLTFGNEAIAQSVAEQSMKLQDLLSQVKSLKEQD